ncbi:MAG: hypothetical protein M3Q93_07520, partial [Gemmatimonadota bacterium]|nr:hypothetical protein [Gemmatimonadota bacterium]
LFVVAMVLAAVAATVAGRARRDVPSLIAAASLMVGAVGLGWGARDWIATAPTGGLVRALAVLVPIGLFLYAVGRLVRLQSRVVQGPTWARRNALAGLLGGAALVAAGTHVPLVLAGLVLSVWSGWLLERAAGGSRMPLAPSLTLVLLPAWWLMRAIAGPEGLAMAALPSLPTSPAAERLLAPLFLVAAWATTGLWPLHRQLPAALAAPVGAMLLARVAIPTVPDGMEHWRPLMMPAIVLGIWHAALSERPSGVAIGLAWVGLLGASRGGVTGAALLLAGALMFDLATAWRERLGRWLPVAVGASALAAGAGGLLAVESGLHAEVVYTVLAVSGVAAAAAAVAPPPRAADGQRSR